MNPKLTAKQLPARGTAELIEAALDLPDPLRWPVGSFERASIMLAKSLAANLRSSEIVSESRLCDLRAARKMVEAARLVDSWLHAGRHKFDEEGRLRLERLRAERVAYDASGKGAGDAGNA